MDIGYFLDIARHRHPDKTALVSLGRRYTYGQLHERVHRLMAVLAGFGVRKGDRVATLMWNRSEMVEAYLATVKLGAMFTPLNYRLKSQDIAYLLAHAEPMAILTEEKCLELCLAGVDEASGPIPVISTSRTQRAGVLSYQELLDAHEPLDSHVDISPRDPAELMYTSGTTGRPKGVELTHENVIWNSLNMIEVRGDVAEDVAMIVGPMFHVAALNSHFTSRLMLGATSVIVGKFDPAEFMELVHSEKVSVVSGNPTMFTILLDNSPPGKCDTSTVSTVTSGADKLPPPLKQKLLGFFPNAEGVFDVFGCTECSPCITTLQAKDSLRKSGSVGKALPYLELKVLDHQGRQVEPGQVGEVVVRGPVVMQGYYRQPQETAEVLSDDGWLHTGDMVRIDDEGFLFVVDRKKDMVITGGENVSSYEVEQAINSHPAVSQVAVVGVHDAKWGEKIVAVVVPKAGESITADEVKDHAKSLLASYKMPKEVNFMDDLPRSGTGKVKKNVLREICADKFGEPHA